MNSLLEIPHFMRRLALRQAVTCSSAGSRRRSSDPDLVVNRRPKLLNNLEMFMGKSFSFPRGLNLRSLCGHAPAGPQVWACACFAHTASQLQGLEKCDEGIHFLALDVWQGRHVFAPLLDVAADIGVGDRVPHYGGQLGLKEPL